MKKIKILTLNLMMAFVMCILMSSAHGTDPTTQVHIVKYASDETTILNEINITYQTMESDLPVCGDGVTHYYHQGPVFDSPPGPWDENETTNFKDKGALKGTDVKELCELVGGMSPGDEINICAVDGMCRPFGYSNVYEPQSRQGPMVICWKKQDDYVPDFNEGMQIVFFADSSTNTEQQHIFGAWDMHESFDEKYWYNYSDIYPSANGLSIKWIDKIVIYSTIEPIKVDQVKVSSSKSSSVITTITISPSAVTLIAGETQQFTAIAYDQYRHAMSNVGFEWASSNETVGTIDNTGLFTAISAGEAILMAENETITEIASITVFTPVSTPVSAPTQDETSSTNTTSSHISPLPSSSPQESQPISTSKSPGLGSLSMILGLMIVSYLIKRKKV